VRNRIAGLVALCLALFASRAEASFHMMEIVEVFPGTPASPNAQYIVLQMYTSGQNFVIGHVIKVYDQNGVEIGSMSFATNVSVGNDQSKILIATTQAQTFFNITPDMVLTTALPLTGGKVCFETVDCVAWGNYSVTDAAVGTPWNRTQPSGLVPSRALKRRLEISGGTTVLDFGDDTNNSLNDFALATPAPVNNAGATGTVPGSTCQNNVVEGIEGCDDNNANADDGCFNCVVERCGDGMDNNVTETCDDGNTVNGDNCDNNCTITACGNGIKTGIEACDDGNPTNGDGCDNNCKVTACGNGIITMGETCDDGNLTSGDNCDANCTPTGCGNGVVTAGEACEPPNTPTCSATCQKQCTMQSHCTDTDPCTTNERCQNDMTCAVDQTPTDDTQPCTTDGCDANGVFHTPLTDGTTCILSGMPSTDAVCVSGVCVVAECGDGFADVTANEQCDDGNSINDDDCTNACTSPACGDNILQTDEECDDGNTAVNDGCSGTCFTEKCGDTLQQTSEGCDDGNAISEDGCSSTCQVESCGDSVVQVIEECDDGNMSANDGCSASCRTERCGDGNMQVGEECDDGNNEDGDMCSATCTKPGGGGCCDASRDTSLPMLGLGLGILALVTRRRRATMRG